MTERRTQRLRVTFTKGESIRYISHLDLARAMERAFRRAELPLVYSQGFNPRPKLAFGSALPLGVMGREEMLDVWLSPSLAPGDFVTRMASKLPAGIRILNAWEVDLHLPSLQASMQWAEYEVHLCSEVSGLEPRIAELLAQETLPRQRQHKGKVQTYDLRPLIADIWLVPGDRRRLGMKLANRSGATGRADQVLAALGLAGETCAIERTRLVWNPS